jgi:hypothetical protein
MGPLSCRFGSNFEFSHKFILFSPNNPENLFPWNLEGRLHTAFKSDIPLENDY